ncbi:hypothetical protein P4233_11235 [Pseudomonas aeruginosa]|nr:hypothetical protein [Pseudomonas aeruginosa]
MGKHFEPSDIRQFQVRRTATNEMEYAPKGVRIEATAFIPDSLIDQLDDDHSPTVWRRSLSSPTKAKTTIKEAKELVNYGKRMQESARTPGSDTLLPLIAYYGTGRLWQQKKLTETKKIQRTSRTVGYTDCLIRLPVTNPSWRGFATGASTPLRHASRHMRRGTG